MNDYNPSINPLLDYRRQQPMHYLALSSEMTLSDEDTSLYFDIAEAGIGIAGLVAGWLGGKVDLSVKYIPKIAQTIIEISEVAVEAVDRTIKDKDKNKEKISAIKCVLKIAKPATGILGVFVEGKPIFESAPQLSKDAISVCEIVVDSTVSNKGDKLIGKTICKAVKAPLEIIESSKDLSGPIMCAAVIIKTQSEVRNITELPLPDSATRGLEMSINMGFEKAKSSKK
jgi:hypothetical protein